MQELEPWKSKYHSVAFIYSTHLGPCSQAIYMYVYLHVAVCPVSVHITYIRIYMQVFTWANDLIYVYNPLIYKLL